jgi:uncharacterized protein YbaR (Trm112 family)
MIDDLACPNSKKEGDGLYICQRKQFCDYKFPFGESVFCGIPFMLPTTDDIKKRDAKQAIVDIMFAEYQLT